MDYRGEIKVAVHNDTENFVMLNAGERMAQIVVMPFLPVEFVEGEVSETERGEGGFGSTGTK